MIFFDIDTQLDFLYPGGALYVPGAEKLARRIGALNHWAAANGHLVASSVDAHSENDPEFRVWPPHCVVGTVGQGKPAITLLDGRVVMPHESTSVALNGAKQVLVEKVSTVFFHGASFQALLRAVPADKYVVYGVVTEICVKDAAFGLLKTGKPVELVTDAAEGLNAAAVVAMYAEFTAAGGRLVTTAAVVGQG
ncbi:MAG: isochorismatase family protein [Acidobacteria bacterium]|nr:isochorismatase family protein [Acidobacteriota bacterium]